MICPEDAGVVGVSGWKGANLPVSRRKHKVDQRKPELLSTNTSPPREPAQRREDRRAGGL